MATEALQVEFWREVEEIAVVLFSLPFQPAVIETVRIVLEVVGFFSLVILWSQHVKNTTPEYFLEQSVLRKYIERETLDDHGLQTVRKSSGRKPSILDNDNRPPNPFVNCTKGNTAYSKFKSVVCGCTLFPIRVVLLFTLVLVGWVFASISVIGAKPGKPLSSFRRAIQYPIRLTARAMLFVCGFYFINSKGRKQSTKKAPVVIGNHVSFIEPIFMLSRYLPSAVGAAEHLKMPIIGSVVAALQNITIDRKSATSRHDVIEKIKARAEEKGWPQTLIFPEGTCTNQVALITFKQGAFIPGVPIQPVVFRFPYKHFDPCWVTDGPQLATLMFRLLTQFVNFMEVTYLPVYTPNEQEQRNPHLYARNVRAVMAEALHCSVTSHSFDDVCLQSDALKLKLPPDVGVLEVSKVQKLFQANRETIKDHLRRFAEIDVRKTGKVNKEEFFMAMEVGEEHRGEFENLFSLMDTDENNEIDFKEYLTAILLLNEEGGQHRMDAIRFAWQVLDADQDGHILKSQLKNVLKKTFPDYPNEDFDKLWAEADKNNDGKLDEEEFVQTVQAHPEYLKLFNQTFFASTQ